MRKIYLCDQPDDEPIIYSGLRGTYDKPITITGNQTIKVNVFGEDPDAAANRIAYLRQENGYFPSVGQVFDQAALVLQDCQHVVLQGLKFDACWPTALYLNNCQNIAIVDCRFGACTNAIGANGVDTRDIWIERCSFNPVSKGYLWDTLDWNQVHGSYENADKGGVVKGDQRHLDGDFFRAWNIAGNVTIRDCDIIDAFNGIHFFNTVDDLSDGENRTMVRFNNGRRSAFNVLIENNRFVRVRDNCIEPEDHAWNWVVRSNTFKDCFAPYSFELNRAGWFYIYDNHHWRTDDLKIVGKRNGGAGFKFGGQQRNEGDIYIFNNSWLFEGNERLLRQKTLGRMKHFNNAIRQKNAKHRLFGSGSLKVNKSNKAKDILKAEKKRFTRRWRDFGIEMDGDWICEAKGSRIDHYRFAGYALGVNTKRKNPKFTKFTKDRPKNVGGGEWLKPSPKARKSGIGWQMKLPGFDEAGKGSGKFQDRYIVDIPAGSSVGAGLSLEQILYLESKLRFVPDEPVKLPKPVKGAKQLRKRKRLDIESLYENEASA